MLLKLLTSWSRSLANCETYKLSAILMIIPRDTLRQLSSIALPSMMAMGSSVASVGGSKGGGDITANRTQLSNLPILLKGMKGWLQSPLARKNGRDFRMVSLCCMWSWWNWYSINVFSDTMYLHNLLLILANIFKILQNGGPRANLHFEGHWWVVCTRKVVLKKISNHNNDSAIWVANRNFFLVGTGQRSHDGCLFFSCCCMHLATVVCLSSLVVPVNIEHCLCGWHGLIS